MRRRACGHATVLAVLALAAAGCGLERQRPVVFAPTPYVMFGAVTRSGAPAAGQLVKVYDAAETALFDSLRTGSTGRYGFTVLPTGALMIKTSSLDTLDFGYVRYPLTRSTASERDSVPPMDLRAHGCAPVTPAADATVPAPNPGVTVVFTWSPMTVAGTIKYKARLADARDSTVWESVREIGTTAEFNGIGTNGVYAGMLVPPGTYSWRVKVRFTNGVQAATAPRRLTFTGAATALAARAARTGGRR